MSDPLACAAACLRRDAPSYPELVEQVAQGRRWWLEQWPDGAPHLLGLLAQDLQEAVHAGRDRLWPPCPEPTCPELGRHPLLIEPDLGPDPFWTCERTGLPVAPVGSLGG